MYSVQVEKRINQINSLFCRMGLWHHGREATLKETRLKIFYSIYFLLFPISMFAGAIKSDNQDEALFLVEFGIMIGVLLCKLWFIIWKKEEIVELLNRICVYSVDSHQEFTLINDKLKSFKKFVTLLLILIHLTVACGILVVPFLGDEKTLYLKIAFPLDWQNNDVAYWIAFAFFVSEAIVTSIAVLFPVIIWYLMLSCALRYEVLGHQIKNMGLMKTVEGTLNQRKASKVEKENLFRRDLVAAIESHKHIKDLTNKLDTSFSALFLVQIATSALCICLSTYSLVFNSGQNLIENGINLVTLCYNCFDIFMVMYFGNEIKLSSDRLSYCLFESDWIERSQSAKKVIIIFGEFLMQPHQLVILTLYPLNLETFMRILNGAYSMFNILKNF